jgi:hypothetical protein
MCNLFREIGNLDSALVYGQQAVVLLEEIAADPEKQFGYLWQTYGWI